MPNALLNIVEKYTGPNALPRAQRFVKGIAQDFWQDGPENPFARFRIKRRGDRHAGFAASPAANTSATPGFWHAIPGEVSEKMWGERSVQPGDDAMTELMINPLNLTKELSVLDLSAGLGSRLRKIANKYGCYVAGLDADAQIAVRGMELSIADGMGKKAAIAPYDPAKFSVEKQYDCIIAREAFYRVAERRKFFMALAAATKGKAQISFTDYIVNPEDREKTAIKSWMTYEQGANPASLVEIAEDWAKAGFNLRVHDDQTAFYVKEIASGIKRLAVFLATAQKPDADTKAALRRRVENWSRRLAAFDQGMKFYRFYGIKQ